MRKRRVKSIPARRTIGMAFRRQRILARAQRLLARSLRTPKLKWFGIDLAEGESRD